MFVIEFENLLFMIVKLFIGEYTIENALENTFCTFISAVLSIYTIYYSLFCSIAYIFRAISLPYNYQVTGAKNVVLSVEV
jgi:hypothetical protein